MSPEVISSTSQALTLYYLNIFLESKKELQISVVQNTSWLV